MIVQPMPSNLTVGLGLSETHAHSCVMNAHGRVWHCPFRVQVNPGRPQMTITGPNVVRSVDFSGTILEVLDATSELVYMTVYKQGAKEVVRRLRGE